MRTPAFCSLLALALGGAAGAQMLTPPALPPASPELLAALNATRSGPASGLIAWANRLAPSDAGGGPLEALETEVANLAPPDRDALLFWLQSHGRAALHARGASDAQIGPPYYPIDYAVVPGPWPASVAMLDLPSPPPLPTPTPQPRRHSNLLGLLAGMIPNAQVPVASSSSSSSTTTNNPDGSQTTTSQSSSSSVSVGVDSAALINLLADAAPRAQSPSGGWRRLVFAASSIDPGAGASQVAITGGFAASRYNGTEGVACLSFVNNAPQAATEVDVDLQMVDAYGFLRRVAALRRSGSFAPGAPVAGPSDVRDANASRPNCVVDGEGSVADPTDPFAAAAAVLYTVREVKYADGSSWLQPGANAWPASLVSNRP